MTEDDCTVWHTTYRWTDLNRDGEPTRPERLDVSTRCIAGASAIPRPSSKQAENTVKVEVESPPEEVGRALENFRMDGEGPNVAFYRGRDGERAELTNVEKIQFYDNVVIIRLRDGTGRLVPVSDFLGVAW
ncbi:hypothetical protein [Enhygromyxa salina]|nr:hypothetical protein [Enhygromyxa salina]